MRAPISVFILGAIAATSWAGPGPAGPPTPAASANVAPRFEGGVASILHTRCARCHGAEETSGGLRLDSYAAVMRGGERGPAVVPGKPKTSLLLRKVLRFDRPPMPPRETLPRDEVQQIRAWIAAGALP